MIIQLNSGSLDKSNASRNSSFDVWIHLLLSLIGENFDDLGGEHIGGLRLVTKPRGGTKFEVWTTVSDPCLMEALSQAILHVIAPLVDARELAHLKLKFCVRFGIVYYFGRLFLEMRDLT